MLIFYKLEVGKIYYFFLLLLFKTGVMAADI